MLTRDLTSGVITRLAIVSAAFASIFAMVLLPGSRGLAHQATVEWLDATATMLTFFSLSLLLTSAFRAMPMLFRSASARVTAAMIAINVPIATLLLVPAMTGPLKPWLTAALMMVAVASAGLGAIAALQMAPSRAGGLALLLVCIGGCARAVSVICAELAAEQARMSWFLAARGLSTLQLAASFILLGLIAIWMATRSKIGLGLAVAAVLLAGIGMWGASKGAAPDALRWQSWLNGALATSRAPESYFGNSLPVLLDLAALGLALCCAFLPRSREALPMALCALCQGTLDVPWRAIAACAAAAWLVAHLAPREGTAASMPPPPPVV